MTLRLKLVLLYLTLGVVPLLGVGALEHLRVTRSLEALVRDRTDELARRSAAEIAARHAAIVSDVRFFGENHESVRWLRAREAWGRRGGPEAGESVDAPADDVARAFLADAWDRLSRDFLRIELMDRGGATLVRLGEPPEVRVVPAHTVVEHPIRDADGERLGTVRATVATGAVLDAEALDAAFGRDGYQLVVDPARRTVVHASSAPGGGTEGPTQGRWPFPDGIDVGRMDADSGSVRFDRDGRRLVGSFRRAGTLPWQVLAIGSVDEFAGPFDAGRRQSLVLLLVVAGVVSVAFLYALHRATRSLEQVTAVAGGVARGRWPDPSELPPEGPDEVGRLSRAFRTMLEEIRSMIARVEHSRQLAVLGEFASRLTHEIRNPLTSIKLNLQRIERRASAAAADASVAEMRAPLAIALREVRRLEALASGVLGLARSPARDPGPLALGRLVQEVADTVRDEVESGGVDFTTRVSTDAATALVDRRGLREALLNLVLNAGHETPSGGEIRVSAFREGPERIAIEVSDTGPGVADEIRQRIFDPFFTTRAEGTGFGLAIAARVVEEQGGELVLADEGRLGGATFRIVLPVRGEPAGAGSDPVSRPSEVAG